MAGGRFSREKGKRGERAVVKLLQPVVNEVYGGLGLEPPELERNLMQSHKGGCDLVGLEWMALEVKHHETLNVNAWWKQAKEQAGVNQEPVLFFKSNNQKWRVCLFGYLIAGTQRVKTRVEVTEEAFLLYLKIRLQQELAQVAVN